MTRSNSIKEDALRFHAKGRPGKLEIAPTKPLTTRRDLSLAYSPGVAHPCEEIAADPSKAYDYTAKGNVVAVISNGTAVLGLGNLGGLASKPVMEGKAVLFKRFADIDGIDLELDTLNVHEFINAVRYLGPSFGGINLEDIRAPDCFIIEQQLRELMDIPVFHDDQHGTAIIAAAGLMNAVHLTGRKMESVKLVINGAGAAGIACAELFKAMGVAHDNVILCDTRGVIYQGREDGMNQWKSAHAANTPARTLAEAAEGADCLVGLSVKGAFTLDMVKSMADNPIIFALANPDPEITPEEVLSEVPRAIMATGRSDYPNQVNNVLGFPYIFRGALDVRARRINDTMKIAAARAIADLAREDVPDEVDAATDGKRLRFGPDYIIPSPFDPRLIERVPVAVAKAAVDSAVAQKPIEDLHAYAQTLRQRLDVTASTLQRIGAAVQANPKRVVFAEGEEERTIRAALAFDQAGYGTPILVGREQVIMDKMRELSIDPTETRIRLANARTEDRSAAYIDALYEKSKRAGKLHRDCQRAVNQNRNIYSAMMVEMGDADAMVTGLTRSFHMAYEDVCRVFNPAEGKEVFGLSMAVSRHRTVFLADTSVHELPSPEVLARIATQAAETARRMGHTPRVALLSFSNFGQPQRSRVEPLQAAMEILDSQERDFEYEGEMTAEVALDYDLMTQLYPFTRLTGPANVLIFPGLHAANIAAKLLRGMGGCELIGPVLHGLNRPVQIAQLSATVTDLLVAAGLAAHQAGQGSK